VLLQPPQDFFHPLTGAGAGCGAMGVTEGLSEFLPVPVVRFDGKKFFLDYDVPLTIGKVRSFYGVVPAVLRAYAWMMSLGSEGLRKWRGWPC